MTRPKTSAMNHFAENVRGIIDDRKVEGWSVSWLANQMNERRRENCPKGGKLELVSRTFLSNLLHGHKPCSIPFAEEVSEVLGVPLHELLAAPLQRKIKQSA